MKISKGNKEISLGAFSGGSSANKIAIAPSENNNFKSNNLQDLVDEIDEKLNTLDDIDYSDIKGTKPPADAQKNVQADWNAESGDAFIKNKPTIQKVTSAGAILTTITASTEDITAGSTTLATGQLYVVYE